MSHGCVLSAEVGAETARAKFNQPRNLILIASFPRSKDRTVEDLNAVASYADHLAPHLKTLLARDHRNLVVLSEQIHGERSEQVENGMLVVRCWKKNSPFCFWQIFRTLCLRFWTVERVLVQFEFNMFGGATTTGLLPVFLGALRLFGWKTCVMLHQVVEDLAEIRAHVGLQGRVRFAIYRRLLRLFYGILAHTAGRMAVHEEVLRERFRKFSKRSVAVIPHGTGEFKCQCSLQEARRELSIPEDAFVLLSFGFLAHYKGSDWLVKEMADHVKANPETDLRLIIGGGQSPNHSGKRHYEEFLDGVRCGADLFPQHIRITGYVPDERVPLYFRAADLVVFPYRAQIAASGPLALALSFGNAFLLSETLRGTLRSPDFQRALKATGLGEQDVVFRMVSGELVRRALALREDTCRREAMRRLSLSVGEARNWNRIAGAYQNFFDH